MNAPSEKETMKADSPWAVYVALGKAIEKVCADNAALTSRLKVADEALTWASRLAGWCHAAKIIIQKSPAHLQPWPIIQKLEDTLHLLRQPLEDDGEGKKETFIETPKAETHFVFPQEPSQVDEGDITP